MSHFIDITGNKYNRLTVLERVEGTTPATWKCICDCGNITFVRGQNLKAERSKAAGVYYMKSIIHIIYRKQRFIIYGTP